MRLAVAALFTAAGIGFISSADAKPMGPSTRIGNWTAGAYSDDSSGRFSHCGALGSYKNGVLMLFMVNRNYEWAVAFSSPTFSLQKGQTIRVGLSLDESAEEAVQAYAIDRNYVRISLAPTSDLFKRFMRGNLLRLIAADQSFSFNLDDTSKLLPFLLKCVHDRLNPAPLQAQNNPKAPNPSSGTEPDLRAEVTSLAANLLSEAGVKGFRLTPDPSRATSVTWSSPGSRGALLVMIDPNVRRPSDLTPRLISIAAEKCKGKFMSGAMPEENGAARSFSSCQVGSAEPSTGYYIALERRAGGHYVIMTWPTEGSGQLKESEPDKDIRNAAYRVLQ